MPKKKFNYTHFYNGKEVSKTEFYIALAKRYSEVIVYDENNPLLNIETFDETKATREYNRLKRTGTLLIVCYEDTGRSESFQIKKERIL